MRAWPRHSLRGWERLVPLSLVIVVAAAYSNSFGGGFIGDDYPAIVNNPDIKTIVGSLRAIFDDRGSSVSGRPVVSLTLAVNYAWDGLNVRGYHATNLAIHVAATLVWFGLIRRTLLAWSRLDDRHQDTARPVRVADARHALPFAAAAAAIWAVHPLHTEAVNYVVQRTELLVGFFFVFMLYSIARAWDSPRGRVWSAAAVLSCLLGMMSKEVMAAGPLVAFLYDYTFFSGSLTGAIRRRPVMYAGLAGCWVVLGAILAAGPRGLSVGFQHPVGALEYLLTQTTVITHYLRLAIWPAPLVISYHDWPIATGILPVLPQAALLTAALGASALGLWRRKWWGFLGVSAFVVLAPSSSFVPIVTEIAAERRMYLPLMTIVLIAAGVLGRALWRRPVEAAGTTRGLRVAGVVVLLVVASLGIATFVRNRDYRDHLTIWADAAEKRPHNAVAQGGLSYGLRERGDLQGALRAAQDAVRLDPEYIEGRFYLAHALQLLDRHEEAVAGYREVLRLDPNHADAMYRLSLSLGHLGRWAEADAVLRRVIEVHPDHTRASHVRAVCLSRLGRNAEALAAARTAVQLDAAFPDAQYNLGWLLAQAGDHASAVPHFKAVLSSKPDDLQARFLLGRSLEELGDTAGAIREYRAVLAIDPRNVEAQGRLDQLEGQTRQSP